MKSRQILLGSRILMSEILGFEQQLYSDIFHIKQAVNWLCRAQDSAQNGGVSEGYHLYHGWLPPYPETTGYVIETFLTYHNQTGDEAIKIRAMKMADWLISIQNDDGSIPDSYFKRKMVFDTGQVIFGLIKCHEEIGSSPYLAAAERAGKWLVQVQASDGTWLKYAVDEIPHTYYSRVAWSLLKLHAHIGEQCYIDAAVKNIEWAIQQQNTFGWFDHASFNKRNHSHPFTHTIAYTMRGILESGLYLEEERYINAVKMAMDHILSVLPADGHVPGTYDAKWRGDSSFSCLTGNAQLAIVLLRLFETTKESQYLIAAKKINHYLKTKQMLSIKNNNVYGAIAGSYPIWGKYIHFAYPNWAAKFYVDVLMLEKRLSNG